MSDKPTGHSSDSWDAIRVMPRTVCGVHESNFRADAILVRVADCLERGDSPETVLAIIRYLCGDRTDGSDRGEA